MNLFKNLRKHDKVTPREKKPQKICKAPHIKKARGLCYLLKLRPQIRLHWSFVMDHA